MFTRRQSITTGAALLLTAPGLAKTSFKQTSLHLDARMISSGDNFPSLRMKNYNAVLAGLFLNDAGVAGRTLNITSKEVDVRIADLIKEGLARDHNGKIRPTALVTLLADFKRLLPVEPALIAATVEAIEAYEPALRTKHNSLAGMRNVPFDDVSLLWLSDVLLDNWQIDRVEAQFLKAERPQRGGGRYYYSVVEVDPNDIEEPLGVYGNHSQSIGDVSLCLYGNQRYRGPTNLVTLNKAVLTSRFSYSADVDVESVQKRLVNGLVARARNSSALIEELDARVLTGLRLLRADGSVAIPVFTPAEDTQLQQTADAFSPKLVAVLEQYRPHLEKQFRRTPYAADEVSFAEYFIWWYHVYYTAVTNALIVRGSIKKPPAGTLTYLIAA